MQVDHHSFFHFFAFLYLHFIPSFHSTSSDFFLFSFCLMFDMGSTSTLYSCLFDVTIPLSSLFVWGPLGPGLMTFSMHCISCMRGMGIISLGSLSLVSICFVHPITLAYVMSWVLRPPWGMTSHVMLDGSYRSNTWDWLEIISWSMTDEELRRWITLGHTSLINDGFSEVIWSTQGHAPLSVTFSFGMTLYWGIAISECAFIRDTVTLLDILHRDTFFASMVDF